MIFLGCVVSDRHLRADIEYFRFTARTRSAAFCLATASRLCRRLSARLPLLTAFRTSRRAKRRRADFTPGTVKMRFTSFESASRRWYWRRQTSGRFRRTSLLHFTLSAHIGRRDARTPPRPANDIASGFHGYFDTRGFRSFIRASVSFDVYLARLRC